jgi:hypothetical protein
MRDLAPTSIRAGNSTDSRGSMAPPDLCARTVNIDETRLNEIKGIFSIKICQKVFTE